VGRTGRAWARLGALEDGELPAEQEDLQLLVTGGPQAQGGEIDEPGEQRGEHEEEHLPSIHWWILAQDSRPQAAPPRGSQGRTTGLVS
jgi:hypothetical protein